MTSDSGRAAKLAASDLTPDQIIEELYLLVYSRLPDEAERDDRPRIVCRKGNVAAASSRRFIVGIAEYAGVYVQGLTDEEAESQAPNDFPNP